MQTNGNQRQEACGKDVAAQSTQVGIEEIKNSVDAGCQCCADWLQHNHSYKTADNDSEQRREEGIQNVRHDLANPSFQISEENTGNQSRQQTAVARIEYLACQRQNNLCIADLCQQRHCSVDNKEAARQSTEDWRTLEFLCGIHADKDGQIGKQCPANYMNDLIPPNTGHYLSGGNINHVNDAVDQACRDNAGQNRHKHVCNML